MDIILISTIGIIVLAAIIIMATGIKIVPQGEEWVIERLGKFYRTLSPGLNLIIPIIDNVRQKIDTRDIILDIEKQEVITKDNAVIVVNGIAFIRVTDTQKAVYGASNVFVATRNLIMTTLRSICGEMTLDEALASRETIKSKAKADIIDDVIDWGVTVKSVEIQDISPSPTMQQSMEQQAAAERERRAMIARAEGEKNAIRLEAEGKLEAAKKEAEAQIKLAEASAQAINMIAEATQGKELPVMFLLGEKYIRGLESLAASDNKATVIYPADIQGALRGLIGEYRKSTTPS